MKIKLQFMLFHTTNKPVSIILFLQKKNNVIDIKRVDDL